MGAFILLLAILVALALFLYWLLIWTEGVFLGERVVVWLYDITAQKYDGIKQIDPEDEQAYLIWPLLKEMRLLATPAPRILDVATGTGNLPYYLLAEPTFQGRVVGLDPSAKMLGVAAEKLRPYGDRAPLVRQSVTSLPFPPASFDVVTCLEALEFFPSDEAALREMARVLRPGGLLLITRRRGRVGWLFGTRYRSQENLEQLLVQIGFTDIQSEIWQVEYDQLFARRVRHL